MDKLTSPWINNAALYLSLLVRVERADGLQRNTRQRGPITALFLCGRSSTSLRHGSGLSSLRKEGMSRERQSLLALIPPPPPSQLTFTRSSIVPSLGFLRGLPVFEIYIRFCSSSAVLCLSFQQGSDDPAGYETMSSF